MLEVDMPAQYSEVSYMEEDLLGKKYANVFAIMTKLRQLCCHRELLPVNWAGIDMNDLAGWAQRQIQQLGTSLKIYSHHSPLEKIEVFWRVTEHLRVWGGTGGLGGSNKPKMKIFYRAVSKNGRPEVHEVHDPLEVP